VYFTAQEIYPSSNQSQAPPRSWTGKDQVSQHSGSRALIQEENCVPTRGTPPRTSDEQSLPDSFHPFLGGRRRCIATLAQQAKCYRVTSMAVPSVQWSTITRYYHRVATVFGGAWKCRITLHMWEGWITMALPMGWVYGMTHTRQASCLSGTPLRTTVGMYCSGEAYTLHRQRPVQRALLICKWNCVCSQPMHEAQLPECMKRVWGGHPS
jgi:hypothetical protein